MNKEQAEKIVDLYVCWENYSCTCSGGSLCDKCIGRPSEEDYQEALKVLGES